MQVFIIQDGFVKIEFEDGSEYQCHTEYLKKILEQGFIEKPGNRKFTVNKNVRQD